MKLKYKEYYNEIDSISYMNYTDKGEFNYKNILTENLKKIYEKKDIKDNKNADIKDIFEHYGLDLNFIVTERSKEETIKSYQIPIMSEDILTLMIKSFRNNKIKNKKEENLTLDEFISYNDKLFKLIEELPPQLQNEIKNTETYIRNKEVEVLLNMLLDRLNLFFSICISDTDINEGGDQIRRLISYLDRFLYNYASHSLDLEELKEKGVEFKSKGEANYLLETLIKQSFLNSIKKNIEILDFFKTNEIEENEIKSELDEILKFNQIKKIQNYDSQNLEILYNSKKKGLDIKNYIRQYKIELEKNQRSILKKQEEIDIMRKNGKYFLNNITNDYAIKKALEIQQLKIIDTVFSVDEEKSVKTSFEEAYYETWENSELYDDMFINAMFKMYPSKQRPASKSQ